MNNEPPRFLLDSFAFLAYLHGEPGQERVEALLTGAARGECTVYASIVNLGEVLYITERERGLEHAQSTLAALDQLPLRVLPAEREAVLAAAHIKANYPLAYADAFAVAAAQAQGATILTGDPEFRSVDNLVRVEWLSR